MKDFFLKLAQIVIAMAVIQIMVVLVFLLWPYNILDVKGVTMNTPTVKVGDSAIYNIEYCKLMEAEGRVYYELIDEGGILWNSLEKEVFRAASCGEASVPIFIPPDIKPGKYQIHVVIHYRANPIRNVVEEFSTPFFNVVSNRLISTKE